MDIVFKQYPSGKISDIQRTALEKAMEQAEVGIESVLEVCKIKDLRDMTIDQFTKICMKLQNTMEKKGKQGDA